jgi:hypothetical protein
MVPVHEAVAIEPIANAAPKMDFDRLIALSSMREVLVDGLRMGSDATVATAPRIGSPPERIRALQPCSLFSNAGVTAPVKAIAWGITSTAAR